MDVSRGEKEQCLICGEELSLLALQSHLANHLEAVALFVLPSTEEDESGDSKASVKVAKLLSQGGASDLGSDCQSLGFSAAGDHGQNPFDFEAQLLGDEMGYTSKISSWERTQDDDITAHDTWGAIQERNLGEHERVVTVEEGLSPATDDWRRRPVIVENPPNPALGASSVSYAAWKATARDHDGHTTTNIYGYLFPADLQHDQFLVMGTPTRMDGDDDAAAAKTSSRLPQSYLVGRDPQCGKLP